MAGRKILPQDPTTAKRNYGHTNSDDSGWNLHYTDLPTKALAPGRRVVFTFFWKNAARWEGRDFAVTVE